MVDGQVVGPVGPVVKALGAKVSWNRYSQQLYISPRSPWLRVDHEPSFGTNPPYSFTELGPVMAVRHLLSERQWDSYNTAASGKPFLVRFEIIDAFNRIGMGYLPTKSEGSTVTAILYWATLRDGPEALRRGLRVVNLRWPNGKEGFQQDGPQLTQVRIEQIAFDVTPDDFRDPVTVDPRTVVTNEPGAQSATAVVVGEAGWTVRRETVTSSKIVNVSERKGVVPFTLGECNGAVPLYDPSVQTFTKAMIGQGWALHER